MLWFAGDLACVSFVLRMPGLQHCAQGQVDKLRADVLERHLVQGGGALWGLKACLTSCIWLVLTNSITFACWHVSA